MVVVVTMLFWSVLVIGAELLVSVMMVLDTMLFWSVVVVIAAALLGP